MSYLKPSYQESIAVNLPTSVRELNLSVTVGYDFHVYRKLSEGVREKHKVGLPFDPDLHDLGQGNAFWVVARDPLGQVVHTQACKLVDLGKASMASYLTENFVRFPPPMPGVNLDQSSYRPGPSAQTMFGSVSYHGEFWLGGEPSVYRGSGLSQQLAQFGYEQARRHWDPDYFFAFILDPVACKGLAARAGWMHTQPRALRWVIDGRQNPIDTFFCHLSRKDLEYLMVMQQEDEAMLDAA